MGKNWSNFLLTLKREKLLSLANIGVMAVTFFILGVFVSVGVVSQTAVKHLEDQAQTTIFFKDDFPESEILKLKESLEQDGRISSVVYISKEDAFEIFKEINKDDPILLESITPEILPASLDIKTKDISDLSVLAGEFEELDGVEEVKFFEDVISRFRSWTNLIYIVGLVLIVIFVLISYSIVVVTLRMTINAKGSELEIMKLVGASNSYVKSPLLFQGFFFGLISSILSSALLGVLYFLIFDLNVFKVTGFENITRINLTLFRELAFSQLVFIGIMSVLLIISGSLLGYIGSWTAVRKYLKY